MLKIAGHGPYAGPKIYCDACGQRITSGDNGNYTWRTGEMGSALDGRIYFTHKRCRETFERENRGEWQTVELAALPIYLGASLEIDWEQSSAFAAHLARRQVSA